MERDSGFNRLWLKYLIDVNFMKIYDYVNKLVGFFLSFGREFVNEGFVSLSFISFIIMWFLFIRVIGLMLIFA